MTRIFQNQVLLLILSLGSSGFMYFSQFAMGRFMSPSDFSVYNSVNSLGVIVITFLSVLNLASAKRLVELSVRPEAVPGFIRRTTFGVVLLVLAISLLALATQALWMEFLNLEDPRAFRSYILLFFVATIAFYFRSLLQGLGRYFLFTGLYFLHTGIFFLLILIWVGMYGGGYLGAFGAATAAAAITLVLTVQCVGKAIGPDSRRSLFKLRSDQGGSLISFPPLRDVLSIGSVTLFIAIFTNLDIPLGRRFFSADEAGHFAAAAIIGRIAFFIPGILPSILFPETIRLESQGKSSLAHLFSALAITALASGVFVAPAMIKPEALMALLMGDQYREAAAILSIQTLSMSLWAFISLFLHFFAAKGMVSALIGNYLVGTLALGLSLYLRDPGPLGLAWAWLEASIAVMIANLSFCLWIRFRSSGGSQVHS